MTQYCYNEACTKDFLNLEKDVLTAKKAGFDLIELRFDCINRYLENHTVYDLKHLLENSGLKTSALNALYIYPEFLSNKDIKEKHDELIKILNCIDELFNVVGINQCIVVAPLLADESLCPTYTHDGVKESCIRTLKYLAKTMPYIKWAFEPVGLTRSLVRNANFANEIITMTGYPNVGLVLDAYNLYLKDRTDCYSFENISGDKVFAVHLTNGKKVPTHETIVDQRYRTFCTKGDAIDLTNFLNALKTINYQGMISTEVFNSEYARQLTQEEIITRAFADLSRILTEYNHTNNYSFS